MTATPDQCLDLDAIKARATAASPGPWTRYSRDFREHRSHSVKSVAGSVVSFVGCGPDRGGAFTDAEFIAHARQDVPALCDEIERLRAENERMVKMVDDFVPMIGSDSLRVADGTLHLDVHGAREIIAAMAEAMTVMLGEAENYVEIDATARDGKAYTLRVQRKEKPTPHELRCRAEAERDTARAALARVTGILDQAETGEHATKSRDYGRGVAHLARLIRDALADPDSHTTKDTP